MGRHVQRSALAAAIVGSAVASVPTGLPLSATTFTAYPGYTGNSTVTGKVSIGHASETAQVLWFMLDGTDPDCTTGTRTATNNACGIHIHAGTSCDSAGGHYYSSNLTSDPWLDVVYMSQGDPSMATGQNVFVETGLTNAAIGGHVVVVHDGEGNRVACAMISAHVTMSPQGYAKSFVNYPGYTGSKTARGEVRVAQLGSGADASQALAFDLTGADTACVPTASISGVNNACGIHIHNGTSCAEAAGIGGHLFNSTAVSSDPWAKIRYFVVDGATTGLTSLVTTGLDWASVLGQVAVLHDVSGTRIACSVITGAGGTSAVSAASMRVPLVWTLAAAAMALRAAM